MSHLNNKHFLFGNFAVSLRWLMCYIQFYANFRFHFQFMLYTVVLPQIVVDDLSVKQHDVHIFPILYIKPSSRLIFCALRLKISGGCVDWTALRSSDN